MSDETLCRFSVCPHDTAKNQVGWFTLNTYLQRLLELRMRFEPQDNVMEERKTVLSSPHHIVYANPFSAVCFAAEGFIPVARPVGVFDETMLVIKSDFDLATATKPVKIASASDKLIIHPLGITLLPSVGLSESDVVFEFVGNHMNAVKAVLNGTAQMAFVFNETWAGMSKTTREMLTVVAETKDGSAFHCFLVGPELKDRAAEVQKVLVGMSTDPAGKSILDELGLKGLEAVSPDVLDPIKKLIA